MKVAAWRIEGGRPVRTQPSGVQLERDLEDWIENDPELVGQGLQIVARQLHLEAGRLDLLAVDPVGRWVVIEIKAGRLHRETIAQALDYASSLAATPEERLRTAIGEYLTKKGAHDVNKTLDRTFDSSFSEAAREIEVVVVGAGTDPALDRLARYLTENYRVPIRAVAFQVLELSDGQQLLLREVTEADEERPQVTATASSVEDVLRVGDGLGVGQAMRILVEAAQRNHLYVRPYKHSLMITTPSNKTRMLLTMWAREEGNLYSSAEAFSEFFPVEEGAVRDLIGLDGWRRLDQETANHVAAGLDELLATSGEGASIPLP